MEINFDYHPNETYPILDIYIYGKYGRLVVLEIVQVHLYFSICRSRVHKCGRWAI